MEYSGRTTCYEHNNEDWKKSPFAGKECISQETVFHVQWSNCPIEVREEVAKLWQDMELGNDHFYYKWDVDDLEGRSVMYPLINEFLKSKNITKCLIHWWW